MRNPIKSTFDVTYRLARRIVIAVLGGTLLIVGMVMVVAPGPAFVVIPLALAILGVEFAWARQWLRKVRSGISGQVARAQAQGAENHRERHRP